jgi:ATP-binding cassette subfamily F protein 3
LEGELRLGASLKIGYFAQANDGLNPDRSVLDELSQHKDLPPEKARNHLAGYLFRGEDVFKPVWALSGGERARLALAILALEGANFLVLDEPTNHLDIPAQEALQEVLFNFNGAILLVSHDRYLIDRLATHIWELKDHKLVVYPGTYREYVLRRPVAASAVKPGQILLRPKPLQRDNSRETRRRAQSLTLLEERIRQQETLLQRLNRERRLAAEARLFESLHDLSWKIAKAQNALESLMAEWEKLAG